MTKEEFEEKLVIGAKIKYGKEYAKEQGVQEGKVITLVKGTFEYDNDFGGGFEEAPGLWCEKQNDYDSIYHLFGNDFEYFLDCEIL